MRHKPIVFLGTMSEKAPKKEKFLCVLFAASVALMRMISRDGLKLFTKLFKYCENFYLKYC